MSRMKKIPCEVYTRIVGYCRPVQNWNEGKKAEYFDRKCFSERKSLERDFMKDRLEKAEIIGNIGGECFVGVKMCSDCQVKKEQIKSSGNGAYISFENPQDCMQFLKSIGVSGDIQLPVRVQLDGYPL